MYRPITIRDKVTQAIDEGVLSAQTIAECCIRWMTSDDLKDMLRAEDIDIDDLLNLARDLNAE